MTAFAVSETYWSPVHCQASACVCVCLYGSHALVVVVRYYELSRENSWQ